MKSTATKTMPERTPVHTEQKLAPPPAPAATPVPTLDSIVQAVCLDAQHESLKYLLRSDTGHDGE